MHRRADGIGRSLRLDLRVRYAETDAMGYLHHSNYLVYFEMGRTELLRTCGISYREMEERGYFYVVAKIDIRYRMPARYDDCVSLLTTTERISPVRIDHRYRLTRGDDLLTEGGSTLVCVNREGRPTAIADDIYAMMTRAAEASEVLR